MPSPYEENRRKLKDELISELPFCYRCGDKPEHSSFSTLPIGNKKYAWISCSKCQNRTNHIARSIHRSESTVEAYISRFTYASNVKLIDKTFLGSGRQKERLRYRYNKQGGRCVYCWRQMKVSDTDIKMNLTATREHLDHVAVRNKSADRISWVVACHECNYGRHSWKGEKWERHWRGLRQAVLSAKGSEGGITDEEVAKLSDFCWDVIDEYTGICNPESRGQVPWDFPWCEREREVWRWSSEWAITGGILSEPECGAGVASGD